MFVDYIFARSEILPPIPACLYQYVMATNGIFVRASRPGLQAQILVAPAMAEPVRGLASLKPYIYIQRVPIGLIYSAFIQAYYAMPHEVLFYLRPDPWRLETPRQVQSSGGVRPVDQGASGDVLIEIHSHHAMDPYFSKADNGDERPGFRVYSVLGCLNKSKPEILTRIGIYGHFSQIPSTSVYHLPPFAF